MKFIQATANMTVNADSIDKITRNVDGFAIIHVGVEEILSSFTYDTLISLLSIDQEKTGDGPSPVATALAY